MLKKSTKIILQVFFFASPFLLLFGLPLLDLRSTKEMELPMISKESQVLLYFGYPGCGVSCPDTLSKLSQAFDKN